jgi:hypothetical protein
MIMMYYLNMLPNCKAVLCYLVVTFSDSLMFRILELESFSACF